MADILIKNGRIIDGTGNPWFYGDVLIRNSKIAAVEPVISVGRNVRVINAGNHFVAPGFIDIHSHSDFAVFANPAATNKIRQGITTEVVGNCGFSAAAPDMAILLDKIIPITIGSFPLKPSWKTLAGYFRALKKLNAAVNIYSLIGLGTIRSAVMGYEPRPAGSSELKKMGRMLQEGLAAGALGLSAGLTYAPGCFCSTAEIVYLCKIAKRQEKLFAAHIRGQGPTLKKAIAEMLKIARLSGVKIHISHLSSDSIDNYGEMKKILALLQNARQKEGIDLTWDKYPFRNRFMPTKSLIPFAFGQMSPAEIAGFVESSQSDSAILARFSHNNCLRDIFLEDSGVPSFVRTGNFLKKIDRLIERGLPGYDAPEYNINAQDVFIADGRASGLKGMTLSELTAKLDLDPLKTLLKIYLEYGPDLIWCVHHESKEDFKALITHPGTIFATDSIIEVNRKYRPYVPPMQRAYGSYPQVIEQLVKKEKLLTLEEAIRKSTSAPASMFNLKKRGTLMVGNYADTVIFDLEKIKNRSTYPRIKRYPSGIKYVINNGKEVFTSQ